MRKVQLTQNMEGSSFLPSMYLSRSPLSQKERKAFNIIRILNKNVFVGCPYHMNFVDRRQVFIPTNH